MPRKGTISTYERGVDLVIEWQIDNFFFLQDWRGACYVSPKFSFGGVRWWLRIWPNDWSRTDSFGQMDLCKENYSTGTPRQSFSLSLKTAKGKRHNEEHYTKVFDYDNWFHKFDRFISRSELAKTKSELVPDSVLTVVCTMKGSTYAENDTERKLEENAENTSADASTQTEEHTGRIYKENPENTIVDASTQTEENSAGSSLCEVLKRMLLDGRNHNVILKVGDKELRAHRDVLRVRSRVLESMLDHNMKEKNTGVIDVPDCDPDAMQLFLSYIYCGKIDSMDHSNMLGLYYIADKYEMVERKRECSDFIRKSLSHTNLCSVIQLALNHSDSDLLACASGYFEDNVLDIMQTMEWQSFLKNNLTVGNELIIKSIKNLKNVQT